MDSHELPLESFNQPVSRSFLVAALCALTITSVTAAMLPTLLANRHQEQSYHVEQVDRLVSAAHDLERMLASFTGDRNSDQAQDIKLNLIRQLRSVELLNPSLSGRYRERSDVYVDALVRVDLAVKSMQDGSHVSQLASAAAGFAEAREALLEALQVR